MSSTLSNESVLVTPAERVPETELAAETPNGIPRWADVAIAIVVLLVMAPVIGLFALAIALTSGTPVFFRQQRVGRGFRSFTMIKLRTMKSANAGPKITRKGDKRITRIGRIVRKTKMDELPALWNVIRGDMALVGPRPEVPEYVDAKNAVWQTVLSVRPGLTDPVTVSLRDEEELLARATDPHAFYVSELQPAKLRGYVQYMQARTVRRDLGVLWQTFVAVIRADR